MPTLNGCRVAITGAGGFIGSHLTEALVRCGARVRAATHYHGHHHGGCLDDLPAPVRSEVDVVAGDIRDAFFVERLLADADCVFHLAALIAIPYSYLAPAAYLETNITGTLHVLEAARRHEVRRVVHTSTSEVYGTARYTPIDEQHPLVAQSPYAASKIAADKLAESYCRSFHTPVVTIRPFNTYGPRQSARAFVPSVLVQALSGDVVRVGALDPIRDMNYVDDTVAGFLAAATVPGLEGSTFNLGSGRGIAMRELLERALGVAGRSCRIEVDAQRLRPAGSEVRELVCDASLARAKLGWEPRVGLDDGLGRTVEWLRGHLTEYTPDLFGV